MSSLRRPVQRNMRAIRTRCLPSVDFISIQREISRGVRQARVLRIDSRGAVSSGTVVNGAPVSSDYKNADFNTAVEANSPEESVLILTPALRRGFSADQPSY